MDYRDYQHLVFERRPNGVVLITINRPEVLNATNDRLHWELTKVWLTLDADDTARVAVVTGAGRAFSAAGDLRDQRRRGGRGPRGGVDVRYQHHVRDGALHRRPHQAGRGGGRSRRHLVAAALRHGQGEVLSADLRLHRWPRGGADRDGEPV